MLSSPFTESYWNLLLKPSLIRLIIPLADSASKMPSFRLKFTQSFYHSPLAPPKIFDKKLTIFRSKVLAS